MSTISIVADVILAIDDIISGNIQEGWNDFILIGAGFAVGKYTMMIKIEEKKARNYHKENR